MIGLILEFNNIINRNTRIDIEKTNLCHLVSAELTEYSRGEDVRPEDFISNGKLLRSDDFTRDEKNLDFERKQL